MKMTSRTIQRFFCLSAAAALLWTGTVIAQEKEAFSADRHKERGLACDACHGEAQPATPAPAKACLTCHESLEAVAERTKDFERNPHNNHLTEASDVECTQCHHGHKTDTPVCHQCHEGMKFEKKQTETK
jgi:fumarate reductase flavoprotein subunit